MPRRSVASLTAIPYAPDRQRIQPPPGLSKAERDLFQEIITQCPADQFVASDSSLLVAYVHAVLLSRHAFQEGDTSTWEKACRTMATLATKLRLCPHSRSDPKTVGRRANAYRSSAYDMESNGD